MPFLFAHTLIFEGPGHGATEKLYFQQPTDDVRGASTFVSPIADLRAALLAKKWSIKAERIALVEDEAGNPIVRRSQLNEFVKNGNGNRVGVEAEISLQIQFYDDKRRFGKRTAMCGPWAEIFPDPDSFTFIGDWTTKWTSWRDKVIDLGFGWLSVSEDSPTKYDVTAYVFNPVTGFTTYTFGEDVPWNKINEPQTVAIEFPAQRSPLDGNQIVVPLTATTARTQKPRPAFPFAQPGSMRLLEDQFISLKPGGATPNGTIDPHKPVERKRGKALLEPRARQPVRIRY